MVVDIGIILSQWEAAGIFDYLLPFLLIFAIVFGVLNTTNILGSNKGIHIIIAVVVGILALRLNFVSAFFAEVFPRLGVGLAVLLTIMILIGLFVPKNERRYWLWGLGAIGFIIAIVVITKSFQNYTWFSFGAYSDYVGWIVGGVLLIGLIIAVAASGNNSNGDKPVAVIGKWNKD